jgi:catabolite repression HPr-like protein
MGMMTLGLANGESVEVIAEGADEEAAVASIENFLGGVQ